MKRKNQYITGMLLLIYSIVWMLTDTIMFYITENETAKLFGLAIFAACITLAFLGYRMVQDFHKYTFLLYQSTLRLESLRAKLGHMYRQADEAVAHEPTEANRNLRDTIGSMKRELDSLITVYGVYG